MLLRAAERLVLQHDPQSNGERNITRRQADALIASGHYRPSTGAPASARHWRRALPDGTCLHLVVERSSRRLHHDAYDPRANLLSLGMHLTHEARFEAASFLALAWSTIRLLAR